ncbi:5068_t:CDS:2, partial [Racocetra fulgida]
MAPTKLQDTELERHVDGKNNSGTANVPGLNIAAAKTTAAQHGNLHIAKNLIENGRVKATDRDAQNVTPLHWAAINNHVVMARYLIDNGAEIDARGGELDATPLHWAASIRDSQGFNGLHIATHSSNTMLVLYLVYHDMDIDTPDVVQHTPLMWAAYQGDPQTVELLINLGASVSKTDAAQFTPLHWAMIKGNPLCLRKLIEAGADINAKEENGKTPSDIAREMKANRESSRIYGVSYDDGDFMISTPPYIPNSSDSCFLNDFLCGIFHYDMWTASIDIWIGLNVIWIIGLILTQGYQIAKAKTTYEMANLHRYSYFGNYNNINVREQIMATLAAAPSASRTSQADDNDDDDIYGTDDNTDNNFGGDHRHGMRYTSLNSQHSAASLRMFSGRRTTRRKHFNDRNGNPFDFGYWNNCVDFWSQGHGGMMQKIDWRELYDVPFERYGNLKPRNGYVDIRD